MHRVSAPLPVDSVVAGILEDVAAREARVPFQEIKATSYDAPEPRDAHAALLRRGCSVIVEIKRAVPYRGTLPHIESSPEMARAIEDAGVHLLACQTEKLRFAGSLEDMWSARQATSVPMFCRDIIVDPYQVHEARCYGADMIPLQVELLGQARLVSLIDRTESLGMTAVAEVRTPEEADRAIEAGARVIGINAWSVTSDEIDRDNFANIVPGLPQELVRIAMGGIRSPKDLMHYASIGADAVMVGETVMASDDPPAMARRMTAMGQHPACPSR